MPGFKKFLPEVRFGGERITPDEVDTPVYYQVHKPSVGTAAFATITAGTVSGNMTLVTSQPDYPRNLLVTIVGPAGGAGGTINVTGYNQFGDPQTEAIGFATAAAGGTAAGTKIWGKFGTIAYVHAGGDNTSTVTVGAAIGTAAGLVGYLGLPVRIKNVSDVKNITWIKNGTYTPINLGTIDSTLVSTSLHAFRGTAIMAATDEWTVVVRSTYNSEGNRKQWS